MQLLHLRIDDIQEMLLGEVARKRAASTQSPHLPAGFTPQVRGNSRGHLRQVIHRRRRRRRRRRRPHCRGDDEFSLVFLLAV